MNQSELNAWWEGHPRSVRLAVQRYRPLFVDAGDFESELYLHCVSRMRTYDREHPVSHWLCKEAEVLRGRLIGRAQRGKRDWRVQTVSMDAPPTEEEVACELLAAPEYPLEEVLDAGRILRGAGLSPTQWSVLQGTACGYSSAELARMLGITEDRVRHSRCEARQALAEALAQQKDDVRPRHAGAAPRLGV